MNDRHTGIGQYVGRTRGPRRDVLHLLLSWMKSFVDTLIFLITDVLRLVSVVWLIHELSPSIIVYSLPTFFDTHLERRRPHRYSHRLEVTRGRLTQMNGTVETDEGPTHRT